jgi:hypothetical protein
MQHSDKPFEELARAKAAIEAMKTAKTLPELEEHWKEFLRRLERVWNKAAHHFGRSPKWNGWQGRHDTARRKDPLLAYLVNARGAEEHTITPIASSKDASIGIGAGPTGSTYIKRLSIQNGQVEWEGEGSLAITFHAAEFKLLPVVNRGRTYDPPRVHQGRAVNPANALEIAAAGIVYYETFLSDAEAAFVAA